MSEATPVNVQAFMPYNGGLGVRLSVSGTSSNRGIPGTQGTDNNRVLITNGGSISAFILMGVSGVVANTNCLEILPGTQVLLALPLNYPAAISIAAITVSGDTTIQATAGAGM